MQQTLTADADADALDALERLAATEAAVYAAQVRALADAARHSRRLEGERGVERFLTLDVAGTLRIGQLAASARLADAERLVDALPCTLAGLESGTVLCGQARIVLAETRHCSERVAAEVERRALDVADLDGWTGSRLRRRVKALVLSVEAELDAPATEARQRAARADRRVSVRPEPDGMASLWALLPAEGARAFAVGLDELERRQRLADPTDGLERTADQRRSDLLALLPALALHALDGTSPGAGGMHPAVVVHVHVPVATALGLSDAPGDLDGYGPVCATQVRLLLPTAQLRRVLVDESTGEPLLTAEDLAAGRRRPGRAWRDVIRRMLPDQVVEVVDGPEAGHDPSAPLARYARVREPLCSGPGCATGSARSDLDHARPWPSGPTAAWNLGPKSRRCHRAKTFSWTVTRSADGVHTWTSPTGRRYTVPAPWRPPPRRLWTQVRDATPVTPTGPPPVRSSRAGPPQAADAADVGLAADLDPPPAAPPSAHAPATRLEPPF